MKPGVNCQAQGRKGKPSCICNPCNRRDQKLNAILRDDSDLANDFEDLPKEKDELRTMFLDQDKAIVKEGIQAAITWQKQVNKTQMLENMAVPRPLAVLTTEGY